MIRATIVHCPQPDCPAFFVSSGTVDPGLWLTVHIDQRHAELAYDAETLGRRALRELQARVEGRRN